MGCICTPTVYLLSNNLVLPRSRTKALPQGISARKDSRSRELFFRTRAKAKTSFLGVHAVNKLPSLDLDLKLEDSGSGGNHINNKDGHGGSGGGSGGGNDHFDNDDGRTGGCGPFRFDFIAWFYWFKKVLSAEIRGDFIFGADKELLRKRLAGCVLSLLVCICHVHLDSAIAFGKTSGDEKPMQDEVTVWEVRGSKWTRLLTDPFKDQFLVTGSSPLPSLESGKAFDADFVNSVLLNFRGIWVQGKALFLRLMLPEGYPDSVTSDYLDYSLWRGVQGIASQISGVLATQSLLYAVGLGKGAIPTAAAINWVLKDGIGYLSKIALSKYGRHFDVNPKGWRLFADFVENAAFGLEILTPAFPQHFVFIGAVAGASRSAATLIQAATRSCFYAGFAAKRNFAEVIAKGEAQGMVSKFIGIMLGISLANCIGSSTPLALASFVVVTGIHMYCNLKSYQSIQLRSLNPYRASLIFSEYLLSAQVPTVEEVNTEEPLFPPIPQLNLGATYQRLASGVMSAEAKDAAADIDCRLHLGAQLSNVVQTRDDAIALINLYRNEGYILTVHQDKFCVILKESATPRDMLKSIFQVNYLFWLERNAGIKSMSVANDCGPGGKLQLSLDYVQREFSHVKNDSELVGWVADGLIARPTSNRVSLDPFPSQ